MKPGVVLALILVILVPAGLFVASAARMHADQRMVLAHRVAALREQALAQAERTLQTWLGGQARSLDQHLHRTGLDFRDLRSLVRETPEVRQALHMDASGGRLFPPQSVPLTAQEQDFIARTRSLWSGHGILYPQGPEGGQAEHGWYAWFWADEMNLIRWVRRSDGSLLGVELEPARLLADLIGQLDLPAPPAALLRLRNERGMQVYQWGAPVAADAPVVAVRPLQAPLSAWRLEYVDAAAPAGALPPVWLIGVVVLACLLMVALAGYIFRAHRREIREASQRVSFVNQVSHELKTPLTNIRMYGELLDRELPGEDARARGYLAVIIAESERLSRLIANVLSFARSERRRLEVTPRPADIEVVIDEVLASFRPGLEQAGIRVERHRRADGRAAIDGDAIGQILNNLVGNVEKYAAAGGLLRIATRRAGDRLEIAVEDHGPGVPAGEEKSIFEPFYRVDDSLSGAAAGTGIGLSVARELARLHGGDLQLVAAESGCHFVLTLHAPAAEEQQ